MMERPPKWSRAELIDPIEERLLAIEGIKEMRSSARQGRAQLLWSLISIAMSMSSYRKCKLL